MLALWQTAFQVLHTYFLPSWETAGSNSYKRAGVWDLTARFESGLLHFLAVRPWASYLTPLYLDFLIWKMAITIVLILQVCFVNFYNLCTIIFVEYFTQWRNVSDPYWLTWKGLEDTLLSEWNKLQQSTHGMNSFKNTCKHKKGPGAFISDW